MVQLHSLIKNMPVIAIAPNDELLEKLKSNLQEVKSRGSQMIVFEDENSKVNSNGCNGSNSNYF